MVGPLCIALANHWVRGWLGSGQRDGVMETGLRIAGRVSPVAGFLCLALPWNAQLPAAATLSLLNGAVLFWVTIRAYLLGDRLAAGMALGSCLALPAIIGLYGIAMRLWELPALVQALLALCAVACTCCVGVDDLAAQPPARAARPEGGIGLPARPRDQVHGGVGAGAQA